MEQYLENLSLIVEDGAEKGDRTGTGTTSLHNVQLRSHLQRDWPLLTTKKVSIINVLTEWKWMMLGMTDVRWLQENNCTIWDEWATISQCNKFKRIVGDMGPIYGHQWRNFGASKNPKVAMLWEAWRSYLVNEFPVEDVGYDDVTNPYELRDRVIQERYDRICKRQGAGAAFELVGDISNLKYIYGYEKNGFDQIAWLIKELKFNPNSRRLVVTGWNPKEAGDVALPPCHTLWQMQTTPDGEGNIELNLSVHARSTDYVLGAPYNIAFYGFMIEFFAAMLNFVPGEVAMTSVDAHVYSNHLEAVDTQLGRQPLDSPTFKFSDSYLKRLQGFGELITPDTSLRTIGEWLNPLILELDVRKDVIMENYSHYPAIKADVAV